MCRGGHTDLLLFQTAVRSAKSITSSESEAMSWFWPIAPVSTSCWLWQFDKIFQDVLLESCNRLSNIPTVRCLFHKKMLLFLQVVSAPSPDVLKENELSSMTTCAKDINIFHVPKISFSSMSFEMNTEWKLDLLLMAYIPVSVWLKDVTIASISMLESRCGL